MSESVRSAEDLPLVSFLLPNGSEVDFESFLRALDTDTDGVQFALNVTTGAIERMREGDGDRQDVPVEPVLPHVRQRWMTAFVDFVRDEEATLYEQLRALLHRGCSERIFANTIRAYGSGWIGAWEQHRHDALYTIAQERLRALRAFDIEVRERFNPVDDDCPLCQMLVDADDTSNGPPI